MRYSRIWAMPNHQTFKIKPIRSLLNRYIDVKNQLWIDPFANRKHQFANITNDMNPNSNTDYNLDFYDFLSKFGPGKVYGILLDPPYSLRQVKECYSQYGMKVTQKETRYNSYNRSWDQILRIQPEYVIQFGWHTNGRKDYYGDPIEILQVPHGGIHNDTIVSVWRLANTNLEEWF